MGLVLAAFVGAAFAIPTLAPVAISDDFLYARSVEILVRDHQLRVLPAAAMSLVFQIGWGGLFAEIFGDSLGVLRASTVTFAAVGGLAMYALCRELRVSPGRSALGAAVFLFNPISFALGYTFMTDTYLLTLVTVSMWCYVRGLRSGAPDTRWTVAGSAAAGLAFLVRQPGILVVAGVITFLLMRRQLRWDRRSAGVLARVALAPVVIAIGYLVWYRFVQGVPDDSAQSGTLRSIGDAGVGGALELSRRLVVITATYVGLFALPIAIAAVVALPRMLRGFDRRRWTAFAVATAVPALCALGTFGLFTGRRPWTPQFFGPEGVGPIDLRGGRPDLLPAPLIDVLLTLSLGAAVVLLVAGLSRRDHDVPGLGLLLPVGAWLAIGIVPQSMPLRDTAYSYDRYFLPLLPLVVAGLLAFLRPVRILTPLAWAAVVAMGAYSVTATHDFLSFQRATWQLATEATADGDAPPNLDAGVAWDGYHLYESSRRHKVRVDLRKLRELGFTGPLQLSERDIVPWWIGYYARSADSRTLVAGDRLYGYEVVRRLAYSSWLHRDPQYVYLLEARE
jgi:hypothetical protein